MSKPIDLWDAVKEIHNTVKDSVNNSLKEKLYTISAEILDIKQKNYGSFNYKYKYIDVTGINDEGRIQLIVPVDLTVGLKERHIYEFTGYFEVASNLSYGFYQFRVTQVNYIGLSNSILAKQSALNEIVEKGLLKKRKNDFLSFKGMEQCRVAIVSSSRSKAVDDVNILLNDRRGIQTHLIHVNLYDEKSIADGLRSAENGNFDVVLLVRGGGSEREFEVFNSKTVIEQISQMKTPVIVGLGHTSNQTIIDTVADRSETTPTSAAKFLLDVLGDAPKYNYSNQAYKNYNNRKQQQAKGGCLSLLFGMLLIILVVYLGKAF
jgi:exodeoxyribonuclease VII large subunit